MRDELAARGHVLRVVGDWTVGGQVCAATIDLAAGRMEAASPRGRIAYALGY